MSKRSRRQNEEVRADMWYDHLWKGMTDERGGWFEGWSWERVRE